MNWTLLLRVFSLARKGLDIILTLENKNVAVCGEKRHKYRANSVSERHFMAQFIEFEAEED